MITQQQFSLLRSQPHFTKLHAHIFSPKVLFQTTVSDALIVNGERVIKYGAVSGTGTWADVKAGMTLLVGSVPLGRDLGKIRIRSATSNTITVSENSNIPWANGLYLTVLKFYELWPVYPRIITNPSNDEDVIFYKDYDVAYSNQNSVLGTFINAGPHRAKALGTTGTSIYYSASGTYNLKGESLTYAWTFEGGTPSTSSSHTPGLVTYPTPGEYITDLRVTSSGGGDDTTHRYVSIYDPNDPRDSRIEILDIYESRESGGATATVRLYGNVDRAVDGAVVIITKDTWYGSTNINLGGNSLNNSDVFLVGYILGATLNFNPVDKYVEFQIGSITELMKKSLGFAVSVESKPSPSKWFELLDMNVKKAIYHYLKWHTTALSISDFEFVGPDFPIQFFDSDRESMFDAIDNLMRNTLVGKVSADMQGKIWAEVDAQALPNANTVLPISQLTSADWMDKTTIEEDSHNAVSYLELGGVAYSGSSTGTFSALLSCAPGEVPAFYGEIDTRSGLALASQAQLNALTGLLYANLNSNFKSSDMTMIGNYGPISSVPQSLYTLPQDTSDIKLERIPSYYIPKSVSWEYSAEHGKLIPTITFDPIVTAYAMGQSIIIPDPPDDGGGGGGGRRRVKLPPIVVPELPTYGAIIKFIDGYGSCNSTTTGYTDWGMGQLTIATGMTSVTGSSSTTGSYADTVYQWPSVFAPDNNSSFIDILQPGVYRINVILNATTPSLLPSTEEYLYVSWAGSINVPAHTQVASGSLPYILPFKVGDLSHKKTIVLSDTFLLLAGDYVGVNLFTPPLSTKVYSATANIAIEKVG